MLNLSDFRLLQQGGESRDGSAQAINSVRVCSDYGDEIFYREWPRVSAADDEARLLQSYREYNALMMRRRWQTECLTK